MNSLSRTSWAAAIVLLFLFLGDLQAPANVTARYVRIDNPTGFAMQIRQIEIYSGGQNILLHHPEMLTGTVPPQKDNTSPTPQNIIIANSGPAHDATNGDTDTSHRSSEWRAYTDANNANYLNPWIEVDLGKPVDIEKIVVYGAGYPKTFYLDKGHRVISTMDEKRKVTWAAKWQYYDQKTYPTGVFSFAPVEQTPQQNPVVGTVVPEKAPDWVSMAWLLNAENANPVSDPEVRMRHFADRNSPVEVERLAKRFFAEIDPKAPGMETAWQLYNAGKYSEALDAWKKYWFAKMWRINSHQALHVNYVSYTANGDDLMKGIMVTITPGEARAIKYTPGQIHWIDLPSTKGPALRQAIDDCVRKSTVGMVSWPLLYAYRSHPDPKYIQRWSEITDDWSLNFFVDAEKPIYEVENLFTFDPGHAWGTTLEDLADIAKEHPAMVDQIPATTLARMQLICLEKYTTAWWRQARGTVFNHNTGGFYSYDPTLYYVEEFFPGQRARHEWRQGFERFMTLGTERDGSLTEIGDEGHMEIPILLGSITKRADVSKPAWYTKGWQNRFYGFYDNLFFYMFRDLTPGGYEHRFYATDYRPQRWTSSWKPYLTGRPTQPVDRDVQIFGNPEMRRILDAVAHISSGVPQTTDPAYKPIIDAMQRSHDDVQAFLNNDKFKAVASNNNAAQPASGNVKPGAPHVNSDWMPYTGAYYLRGGWGENEPFLSMMACGSHGGSQAPQWQYGVMWQYDYNYPLFASLPIQVDGMQPQQLYGRMNCFQPGTKTMCLTNADETPAQHRWLSDSHFDFGEAIFDGAYQRYASFKGDWDTENLEQNPLGNAVTGMHTVRQIIQLRGPRLWILTDATQSPDGASHEYSVPYTVSLSSRGDKASKPFGPDQLKLDDAKMQIQSDNPDGPSMTVYQFADQPIKYKRGNDAKLEGHYQRRVGNVQIADQPVSAVVKAAKLSMVSVMSSRDKGAQDRIASIEPLNQGGAVGFHAKLQNGGEIWYQAAPLGSASLTCGPGSATAQALLVMTGKDGTTGMVLGSKGMTLGGVPLTATTPDFEFVSASGHGNAQITNIYTPIDPVSFLPNRNAFFDSESVQMVSKTPHVEIHYTTDGTSPTLASKLYTGPVTITDSTDFTARAYRLGANGKPLPADDFEINGTKFTVPSYGWFTKRALNPPAQVAAAELKPGLNYDYLQAPWWQLYSEAHWLPAEGGGTVDRVMDLSKVSTGASYGMRYKGYIKVPQDGVYTFQAPHEMSYMDNAPSYDLRVYVDGEEWYLTQWWHGHGTWSIPLKAGLHSFQLDFADARTNPYHRSGIWNFYPRPWAIYKGNPTDVLVTGPGIDHQPIPTGWFFRQSEARTYADERTLIDATHQLNTSWDNNVDAPLTGIEEICFRTVNDAGTSANPAQVFANVALVKSDGTKVPFSQAMHDLGANGLGGGIFLNLHGQFDHMTGPLSLASGENAVVLYHNTAEKKETASTP
jgi:hypothetical protein